MAIYPCKICGNPMDPIVSDGICDDCYFGQSSFLPLKNDKKSRASSRSASSGKKKRKKIQKVAALIMAMMIALSSLCLSAFAEDTFTEVLTDGTYMGYEVIKYEPGTEIFNKTLISYFDARWNYTDNPTQYLSFCLLDFDASGNPYIYTLSSTGFGLSVRLDGSNIHSFSFIGYSLVCEVTYDPSYFRSIYMSWQDNFNFYTFESSDPDNKKEYTRTLYCNGGEFSGYQDSDKYLLLIPHSDANQATPIFNQLLTGSKDDFQSYYSNKNFSAKFHSFASMNDNVGGLQGILNMIDWLGMGNQYPTCDFSINDNGNHHSYSLRISTNKNYVDICMSLWEDYRLNKLVQTGSTAIALAFTPDIISKFVLASTNGAIDVFGIRNNADNITDAVRFAAQVKFLQSIEDLSYVTEYNLTNQHMRFNEGESSSRAYSVCLADYVSIVKGLVYKLEIIDNNTGIVLDKAYFCNDTSFQKTNTGYGTKVYNYDDYNDLLGDIDKGNDYGSSSGTIESDKLQTDNNNDIIVNFDPTQLDLGSYMDSLNGIVSNVSSFFTWVWALFPPEIMTIIIMGVGLLITCGLIKFFVG